EDIIVGVLWRVVVVQSKLEQIAGRIDPKCFADFGIKQLQCSRGIFLCVIEGIREFAGESQQIIDANIDQRNLGVQSAPNRVNFAEEIAQHDERVDIRFDTEIDVSDRQQMC